MALFEVAIFVLFASASCNEITYWKKLAADINSRDVTWTARSDFASTIDKNDYKSLAGTFLEPHVNNDKFGENDENLFRDNIPESFDAREKWPHCNYTISHIRDQGACGSCWATAAAATFSDRVCIARGGTWNGTIATEDVLACTWIGGCWGGWLRTAWLHIKYTGAVTGGDHGSGQGCKPYSIQECNHHGTSERPKCSELASSTSTPKCTRHCSNYEYSTTLKQDLIKAKQYYSVSGESNMQRAILAGGPLEAGFYVYEDFVLYREGVYSHFSGKFLGGHAVKVFGWGEESGVKYWLVANSWNTDWGEKGFFKIKRGTNECNFEKNAYFGVLS